MITQSNSLNLPLASNTVQTCVTSPPYYGLRDYGEKAQIGQEETPEAYVAKLVDVFREVKRVLKNDGTLWLNLGDSYATGTKADRQPSTGLLKGHTAQDIRRIGTPAGCKTKDLIGIPWMVAFALRADGWYLRSDIIWAKPNPMPESVRDRPTKSHEYIFLLSKSQTYYYDHEAIKEDSKWSGDPRAGYGRIHYRGKREGVEGTGQENFVHVTQKKNKRDVWTVTTKPYKGAHFATFNPALIEPCVLAGSAKGHLVLDPFNGSGTTGEVALKHGRRYFGSELNMDYIRLSQERLAKIQTHF